MDMTELERWFQERPKWMQDAARRIILSGTLSDADLDELFEICHSEATGRPVIYTGIPSGALSIQDIKKPLRLDSIENVQGINALSPRKPLEFGNTPLCIVYGQNGSGKSGYVRLLKHTCGTPFPGDLLGNVFKTDNPSKSAIIKCTEDTGPKTCEWTGEPISEFNGVDIYDTACGLVYVNEENEVAFEPLLLQKFSQITNACTALSQIIQSKIKEKISQKPLLPPEYSKTITGSWYERITCDATAEEIDSHTTWESQNETELTEINKRIFEPDPTKKATALRHKKDLLLSFIVELKRYHDELSQERCNAFLQLKIDAINKRKTADEDAKNVFENTPLFGVGSDSWRLLWEAARKYSEEHAYEQITFPNISSDARCVLCHQELDHNSRGRLDSFEKFVKGEIQLIAAKAELEFNNLLDSFTELPKPAALNVTMDAIGITDDSIKAKVLDLCASLLKRKQSCIGAGKPEDISPLPPIDILVTLNKIATDLEKLAVACDEDAKGNKRKELEQKGRELSSRKWLHQQQKAIDAEMIRLKIIDIYNKMDKLTNTRALSICKSSLADELITTTYIQRFRDELKHLGAGHLAVELKKTRADVGHIYHKIILKNSSTDVKTSDILSEGEFRIVSLAAFLADTEGRGAKTPFVFDDPISSLDHIYENATAERLVKLSQNRQLIVFTHRLSLVGLIEKYSAKYRIESSLVCLSRYTPGDVADLPIDLHRTDKAINLLLSERLASVKKTVPQGDSAYEKEAKSICRDIRILLERIVEKDLINEVIRRFSPEVNTKGKIHALANIEEEDCIFIDDYMTKYSRYEHSQPEETPVPLPKPDEIKADLEAIKKFIERIQERNKG